MIRFRNNKSSLPTFSIEKILKSHEISFKKVVSNEIRNNELNWINSSKKTKALIIKVKYESSVSVEK